MFGFLKRHRDEGPEVGAARAARHVDGDDETEVGFWRAARVPLVVALIVVVSGLAVVTGLKAMRRRAESLDRYKFDPAAFRAVDLPEWVRTNPRLVRLVESAHGLGRVHSLFEEGLCDRIRANYEANPWVRRVLEVRTGPDGVDVRLELRRPVAGVAHTSHGRTLYTLVDREGIRLPGASRRWPTDWMELPLVANARTAPPRPGCRWDEAAVLSAVSIACQLDRWSDRLADAEGRPVRFATIDVTNFGGRENRIAREIVLETAEGARVLYGRSPLRPYAPGEASPEDKMRALAQEVRKVTNLHLVDYIDVAVRGSAITRRRTAGLVETARR